MINHIWFFLIFIGVTISVVTGNISSINTAIIEDAQEAVKFAIGLTGIMAVWIGLMNIAKKSGLIRIFNNSFRPIMKFLFPSIPKNHPAIDAILMNIVTNMFGAGNSATALGIKAMDEMNKLNKDKKIATDAMCMFLVINMSSVQLVPLTVLKIRADSGSLNPTEIIGTSLIATTVSTIVGVISVKLLSSRG